MVEWMSILFVILFHGSLMSEFVGFYLYRRWYISIVPMSSHPGTTKDIDFYAAVPSGNDNIYLPPRKNWMCIPSSGGIMPAPEVYPRTIYDEGDDNQGPNNIVVDQDQTGYL